MSTLITGADGYLARRLTEALLRDGETVVLAARGEGLSRLASRHAGEASVTLVEADLGAPDALAGIDPAKLTRIVHAAAVTRFNVDRETARRGNVEGTAQVCDLAERSPNLERLTLISTLYTAGRHLGEIPETRHGDAGFVNHYEWSKHEAEELACSRGLPLSVLRLPTIVCDDDTGLSITQYNAFHRTLKLYFYGLLSLVPGLAETPLSLASAEFAVRAVLALLDAPEGIVHVCPDAEASTDLGTMIDTAFAVFERDPSFRRRRLLRPLHVDHAGFRDLVSVAEALGKGPINQAVGVVAPYAEQLYLPKTFDNRGLHARWPGYRAPDPVRLVESVCQTLVLTRWGRGPRSPRD
ncbi:SDR family oxidoreductase [Actinocorallia sp. B10E7]|uniref:SDR family oxidoreductase n=1 Tax=Actinocorallia sp. B10E7 TaxID=3153558 RepID=UPI00325D8BB2